MRSTGANSLARRNHWIPASFPCKFPLMLNWWVRYSWAPLLPGEWVCSSTPGMEACHRTVRSSAWCYDERPIKGWECGRQLATKIQTSIEITGLIKALRLKITKMCVCCVCLGQTVSSYSVSLWLTWFFVCLLCDNILIYYLLICAFHIFCSVC